MDLTELPGAPIRRHPWEVARTRFFLQCLRQSGLLGKRLDVLDIGAGDGYVARALLESLPTGSTVVCHDTNYTDAAIKQLSTEQTPCLTFSREAPDGHFDLILLLDVIEHVPNDRAFLSAILDNHVAPQGHVLISVPAWQNLFSKHDEALKHYRRYNPSDCVALLKDVGLVPLHQGGLFHSLLLPRALQVTLERLKTRLGLSVSAPANLGEWRGGPLVSTLVERALAFDCAMTDVLAKANVALPALTYWALGTYSVRTRTCNA